MRAPTPPISDSCIGSILPIELYTASPPQLMSDGRLLRNGIREDLPNTNHYFAMDRSSWAKEIWWRANDCEAQHSAALLASGLMYPARTYCLWPNLQAPRNGYTTEPGAAGLMKRKSTGTSDDTLTVGRITSTPERGMLMSKHPCQGYQTETRDRIKLWVYRSTS